MQVVSENGLNATARRLKASVKLELGFLARSKGDEKSTKRELKRCAVKRQEDAHTNEQPPSNPNHEEKELHRDKKRGGKNEVEGD